MLWFHNFVFDLHCWPQTQTEEGMLGLSHVSHAHVELFTWKLKKDLHLYFSVNIVIGVKSLKAPVLKLIMFFPFDVVPSGKIINGGVLSVVGLLY